MNPFTEHMKNQCLTCREDGSLAMGITWLLMNFVPAFVLDMEFPFIDIEKQPELEAESACFQGRNDWIERAGELPTSRQAVQSPTLTRRITQICAQALLLFAA